MKHNKLLLCSLFLSLSSFAFADETRTYEKVSEVDALVTIQTEETDGTQAAMYVDGKENDRFVQEMLKDKTSPLSEVKKQIEMEMCQETSTDDRGWIDGCGEVTITEMVRTSFGRGGWMSAGASYTFFMGFTQDGTGRFFDVSHMVTIEEMTEAQVDEQDKYNGFVKKFLSLSSIKETKVNAHPSLK